jgi:hypothetical protein
MRKWISFNRLIVLNFANFLFNFTKKADMDIQATKIELVKQLLNVEKESVLNKVKEILSTESVNTVAYATSGEPLTEEKYIEHIKQISNDIENGATTYSSQEVKNYVLNHETQQ